MKTMTAPRTSVRNLAGRTFTLGERVRHNDGWFGTITEIIVPRKGCVRLKVNPENIQEINELEVGYCWPLKTGGFAFGPLDHGVSMGNFCSF